jgi:hypothetical protein
MKRRFGGDHFLTRGCEKGRGERSLRVLGSNRPRVVHILGVRPFIDDGARHLTHSFGYREAPAP